MISIVAPVCNEEKTVGLFVDKAVSTLSSLNLQGEIIIINDGSTDATPAILRDKQIHEKTLVVLSNPKRRGITYSLRRGFEIARGDIYFFFPTDLESDPAEDIPKLLEALHAGYDIAAGWRYQKTENKVKIVSTKLYNWLVRKLFHVNLHDMGWVKAMRKEVIADIDPLRADWHRLLLIFAADQGYRIKEVPLNFYPRKFGESKFGRTGFARIFGAFIDLLVVKFLLQFSRKPMRVFGTTGVFFFAVGFIGGCYLFYIKLTSGTIGNHVPFLFFVVLLIVVGIQFFAFGFLAEMMASIKDRLR